MENTYATKELNSSIATWMSNLDISSSKHKFSLNWVGTHWELITNLLEQDIHSSFTKIELPENY